MQFLFEIEDVFEIGGTRLRPRAGHPACIRPACEGWGAPSHRDSAWRARSDEHRRLRDD
jgi:hypothetical protein